MAQGIDVLVEVEMAAILAGGDCLVRFVELIEGENVYVDAHDEGQMLELPDGGVAVGNLCERHVVTLVSHGDDVVAQRAQLVSHREKPFVITSRHVDVNVVVPRNEALMAYCSQNGSSAAHVGHVVLAEKILCEEEGLEQFRL